MILVIIIQLARQGLSCYVYHDQNHLAATGKSWHPKAGGNIFVCY